MKCKDTCCRNIKWCRLKRLPTVVTWHCMPSWYLPYVSLNRPISGHDAKNRLTWNQKQLFPSNLCNNQPNHTVSRGTQFRSSLPRRYTSYCKVNWHVYCSSYVNGSTYLDQRLDGQMDSRRELLKLCRIRVWALPFNHKGYKKIIPSELCIIAAPVIV
jgi:hypothetical protein